MALQAVMDTLDAIPEQYRDLYTEKNGKYELTGVVGVKTVADVQRIQTALEHEKTNHNQTKEKLTAWGELTPDKVLPLMDRIPELEAAAAGKLDEAAIEEMVQRRVNGTIKSQTAPLERNLTNLQKERDALLQQNQTFVSRERTRTIHDGVGKALAEAKVIDHAREDAIILAERIFEVREDDSKVVTKDGVGVTPGLSPKEWMSEVQAGGAKPHWWGPTGGGGAGGAGGNAGGAADNPWTAEAWNMTRQGQIIREKGQEHAERLAKAAGTKVGGMKPASKK